MRFANVSFTLTIAFVASLVQAAPFVRVEEAKRDVVDPQITSPTSGTVWVVGTSATVTWDTSELTNASNSQGTILLGYLNDSSTNEHLMTSSPLASGFDLTTGSTTVTVPDVTDGTNYIIALLGDSGNISPTFTITSASSSSSSASGSSSSANNDAASSTVLSSASTTLPASVLSTVNPTSSDSIETSSATVSSGSSSSSSQSGSLSTLTVSTSIASSGSASASSSSASASSGSTSAALSNVSLSRLAHLVFPLSMIAAFML